MVKGKTDGITYVPWNNAIASSCTHTCTSVGKLTGRQDKRKTAKILEDIQQAITRYWPRYWQSWQLIKLRLNTYIEKWLMFWTADKNAAFVTLTSSTQTIASSETQGQIVGARERLSLAPTFCPWVSEMAIKILIHCSYKLRISIQRCISILDLLGRYGKKAKTRPLLNS